MQDSTKIAALLIIGSIVSAKAQTPKPTTEPKVYKRIEIKNGDTIVNITKNYSDLTPEEKKEMGNIEIRNFEGGHGVHPLHRKLKRLDSTEINKLKKEGKWVKKDNKDVVFIRRGGGHLADSVFEKRIIRKYRTPGDSTKKEIIIITDGNGAEGEDIVLHRFPGGIDKDVMIERAPGEFPGKKMFLRKRFNQNLELNFTLESKGNMKVVMKDENGKEVFSEERKNFSGNYKKEVQLGPGSYEVIVSQGGKEKLKYKIER